MALFTIPSMSQPNATHARAHPAHAQAGRDGMDMPESTTFGGGGNSEFKAEQARRQAWKQKKQNGKMERVQAARQAEADKMARFAEQMGIKPGQRMTIAARKPGE